jgi:hypothetical protein
MNSPHTLLGFPISDDRFIEFWGKKIEAHELIDPVDSDYLVSNHLKGLSVVLSQNLHVTTIRFFSNENSKLNQKYKCYQGCLPAEIRFGMSLGDIEAKFGLPIKKNTEFRSFLGVDIRPWHYYNCQEYYLTIEFDKSYSYVVGVSISNEEL